MAGENRGGPLAFRTMEDCIMSKGFTLKDLKGSSEKGVIEVSPCASERGKVMAEIELLGEDKPFLDMEILCLLLNSYKNHFAEMRCSTKLGVSRLMWKARRIYIYEKGKFKVRFAHSREDAVETLNSVGRLILGSVLCEICGKPAVECALGKCGKCFSDKYPEVVQLENNFNAPFLMRGINSLEEALKGSQELRNYLLSNKKWPDQIEGNMRRRLRETIEFAMNFALETRDPEDLRIGTTLIAVARENLLILDLERKMTEIKMESPEKFGKSIGKLESAVWWINEKIVEGLFSKSHNKLEEADEKTSEALELLDEIIGSKEYVHKKDVKNILEELKHYIGKNMRLLKKINYIVV